MKRLDWDSKFWEIEIYNFEQKDNLNILDRINIKNQYLVQALVDSDKYKIINKLEEKGFRYVETKVSLIKNTKISSKIIQTESFKDISLDELYGYKNMFGELYYKFSRYNLFCFQKVNDFYYLWAKNSIKGNLDDKCIGYYTNNQLSGFITYKIRNNNLDIGLVGVLPSFQRRGIVQKLLDYITNIAIIENCRNINVSTQGVNYNAINAYIKNGFIIKSIKNWLYLKGEN